MRVSRNKSYYVILTYVSCLNAFDEWNLGLVRFWRGSAKDVRDVKCAGAEWLGIDSQKRRICRHVGQQNREIASA